MNVLTTFQKNAQPMMAVKNRSIALAFRQL